LCFFLEEDMFKSFLKSVFLVIFLLLVCACSDRDEVDSANPTEPSAPVLSTAALPTDDVPPAANLQSSPTTEQTMSEPTTWMRYYGGSRDDTVETILPTEDGGFYLAGSTNSNFETGRPGEAYLLRVDADGDALWERTYPAYSTVQGIRPTEDGGLLISGIVASPDGSNSDIFLMQVDQHGDELWWRTFGGPLDEYGTAWLMDDGGYIVGGIVVDPNDIVVDDPGVAGYGGLSGRSNIYLARFDAEGNELWSRTIGGEDNVMTSGGLMTDDGGFILLANVLNYPLYDDDILLLKIDQSGNEVWSRTWEEGNLDGNALIQTADGNTLIAGGFAPAGDMDLAEKDFLFIKVDPDGNEVWQNIFGDPDVYDWAYAVVQTADGGFVAVGDIARDMISWDSDIILVKIDTDGQFVWQQTIDTNTHTMLRGVLEHPQGGYVIVGTSYQGNDFDILLIHTDAEGNLDQ
jgi:serine-aspartate repeat-containing protein C/D/E